jgi:hypothetical protein
MNISDIEKEVVGQFRNGLPGIQDRVVAAVLALLSRLRVADGRILPTENNYILVETIREELQTIIYREGYLSLLNGYAQGMTRIKAEQDRIFARLIPDWNGTENPYNVVFRNSERTALRTLSGNAVSLQQQEFERIMTTAVGSNSSIADITDAVRANIAGSEVEGFKGRLEAYAGTYAKDAVTVTNATYLDAVSTAYGLDWFAYVGPILDDDSREFCIERVNQVYHREEIRSWAALDWDGKNRATDADSIFALRGGYNCNHNFVPVSVYSVPEEKMKEAIENGWVSSQE